jgi:LDH2 family malate/lactate/ureidoglycolate dehydrogenase
MDATVHPEHRSRSVARAMVHAACASALAEAVRTARPVAGGGAVRMPFDRSRHERQRRLAEDSIEIPDVLFDQLTAIASGSAP